MTRTGGLWLFVYHYPENQIMVKYLLDKTGSFFGDFTPKPGATAP
jgi:hypothetical protein